MHREREKVTTFPYSLPFYATKEELLQGIQFCKNGTLIVIGYQNSGWLKKKLKSYHKYHVV